MFLHGLRAILHKKHNLPNFAKTADTFAHIVRKRYMLGTIPFQGYQMSPLRTFWYKSELSTTFGSRDGILPK